MLNTAFHMIHSLTGPVWWHQFLFESDQFHWTIRWLLSYIRRKRQCNRTLKNLFILSESSTFIRKLLQKQWLKSYLQNLPQHAKEKCFVLNLSLWTSCSQYITHYVNISMILDNNATLNSQTCLKHYKVNPKLIKHCFHYFHPFNLLK